jgi:hypothetical protein
VQRIAQRGLTRWAPPLSASEAVTVTVVPNVDVTAILSRVPARRLQSAAPDRALVSRSPKRTMEFTG